jgi:hypothetical protein
MINHKSSLSSMAVFPLMKPSVYNDAAWPKTVPTMLDPE